MYSAISRLCLLVILGIAVTGLILVQAQSKRRPTAPRQDTKPQTTRPAEESPSPEPTQESAIETPAPQDVDTVKIATDLVTVPVIATDRNGIYAPDLTKEEFTIAENDVKQEIAFFATVSAPFHVVLMLDTSASTQQKLGEIRRAANAFVEQLQPQDRVKIITFDDEVRDLNEFTSDRAALRAAIQKTQAGEGTKLYDAMSLAFDSIKRINGRKAIVLFTDGVDYHSDIATFDSTLKGLDEDGVIVYPIRYDTRADTERIARQQAGDVGPQLPTIGVIRAPSRGTTAPTFPSDDPSSVPTSGSPRTGPLGLPLPEEILRRRRSDPDQDRTGWPNPNGLPPDPTRRTDPNPPIASTRQPPTSSPTDSIGAMLDQLYLTADSYLKQLETKSGGKLLRADTLGSLPDAFAKIAAELRTQYALGYYPTDKTRDGKYRKIRVTSTRKNIVIRARPGYQTTTDQ